MEISFYYLFVVFVSVSGMLVCLLNMYMHMGKNFKMCTNAYLCEKKSELSELHYIFNLLEAKTL